MAQQGDTRVGDDGVRWVFDGGIWRGDHDMYKPCPVFCDGLGRRYQDFPAAAWGRRRRDYSLHHDHYVTDDEE